jgi:hypothetical protein
MTNEEATEIRDRAIRLGLQNCCEECSEDIETLNSLSGGRPGAFAIVPPSHPAAVEATQRKPSVVGTKVEEAARRLRRSIGQPKGAA